MIGLAFRNIGRNRKRTILTAFSIFLAVYIIILLVSICETMIDDMIENEKKYVTGDFRIADRTYLENEDLMPLQFNIDNVDEKIAAIEDLDPAIHAEALIKTGVYAYLDGELETAFAVGVEIGKSAYTSDGGTKLIAGRLPENGKKEIAATTRLLSRLGLSVGDRITLMVRTTTSSTNAATFDITGEIAFSSADLNADTVIVPLDVLSRLCRMEKGALEILVTCDGNEDEEKYLSAIKEALDAENLRIDYWKDSSMAYSFIPLFDTTYAIVELLFFLISSTLIFNTTMMCVLERKKEIGTMIAFGFRRSTVIIQFVVETAIISLFGTLAAGVAGAATLALIDSVGLDLNALGGEAVQGWNFSNMLYPEIGLPMLAEITATGLAVAVLAAFLATYRIRKIEVANALREED